MGLGKHMEDLVHQEIKTHEADETHEIEVTGRWAGQGKRGELGAACCCSARAPPARNLAKALGPVGKGPPHPLLPAAAPASKLGAPGFAGGLQVGAAALGHGRTGASLAADLAVPFWHVGSWLHVVLATLAPTRFVEAWVLVWRHVGAGAAGARPRRRQWRQGRRRGMRRGRRR